MKFGYICFGLLIVHIAIGQHSRGAQKLIIPPDLKEALERSKSLRFSGTRTVMVIRAGQVQSHNEYVTKDGENLRIEFAKGSPYAGQIIVETSEERKHYFPDRNEIREYPSFGKRQFEGVRAVFRSPRGGASHIESSNGGVIAGLHCTKYQVSDSFNNPIVQVFIEPNSGMLAKRVLFDPTGNIAGSYEFVSVNLNPNIQKSAFKIFRKGAKIIRPIDELKKQGAILGMPALSLGRSSGYRLESVYVREVKGSKVIVQNYGKDDSRITVFMTKSELNPADLKKYNRGELASDVRTLNGLTIVVMGDQPEERLRALSNLLSE
jgi:hypothetical protein